MIQLIATFFASVATLTIFRAFLTWLKDAPPPDLSRLHPWARTFLLAAAPILRQVALTLCAVFLALMVGAAYLGSTSAQDRAGLRAFGDTAPVALQLLLGLALGGVAVVLFTISHRLASPVTPLVRRGIDRATRLTGFQP